MKQMNVYYIQDIHIIGYMCIWNIKICLIENNNIFNALFKRKNEYWTKLFTTFLVLTVFMGLLKKNLHGNLRSIIFKL